MPRLTYACLLLCLAAGLHAQTKPLCFLPATTYTYGGLIINHVTADFNGDGYKDLAGGNLGSDQVMIYLNDKKGHFTYFAQYPTQYIPQDLVAADLNNDQNMDLVAINSLSASLSVFMGNGNGSFQVAPTLTVLTLPKGIATEDFNKDGNADLVVTCYNPGKMMVMLGTGLGNFQPPTIYNTKIGVETVATGDFNGDNKTDIATTVWTYNELNIWYGNGDGTFQQEVTFGHAPFDNYTEDIVVADFNSDNFDDVALIDGQNFNMTLFKGTSSGMSAYQLIGTALPAVNFQALAAADVNDDGFIDIVTPSVQFYLGQGNGLFGVTNTYTTPPGNAVVVDDLNHDRKPDLALAGLQINGTTSAFIIALNGPTLSVSGLAPYLCASFSPTLHASGAGTYSWSTGAQTSTMTMPFNSNTTLTLHGFTSNGCANSKTLDVVVKPNADSATLASMSLMLNHYGPFCKGDQVRMCVNGAVSFTWSMVAPNQTCIQYFPQSTQQITVTVMNEGGCIKEFKQNLIVNECVGLEETHATIGIKMYPNPASNAVIVESESTDSFELYDYTGKLVLKSLLVAGSNVIEVSELKSGFYVACTGAGRRMRMVVAH